MEEKVAYERLLPYEFAERIGACPLVYVPVGSLEWHGEQLALGNDAIKMHGLCLEAARLGGGIVYPPIYYCMPGLTDGDLSKYKHNPTFYGEPEVLKTLLLSTLAGLEKVGFKAAVLTTGHTPREQIAMMKEVAAAYDGDMRVAGTCDAEQADEIEFTSDHAAMWETSILWHLRPELVDITRLERDPDVKPFNVFGKDPRFHASPGLGRKSVAVIARDLAALGSRLLAERD
jgi:creatinine amidohydrolase